MVECCPASVQVVQRTIAEATAIGGLTGGSVFDVGQTLLKAARPVKRQPTRLVIATTADRMMAAASSVRPVMGSAAKAHPSSRATTGFTYA